MDPSLVKPELDQELIAVAKEYVAAVDAGDLDAMEQWYAPAFVNIRFDKAGHAVNLPKQAFMELLRGWAQEGGEHPLAEAQKTDFVATSRYADCASVLMIRVKGSETVSYNFVLQKQQEQWRVLREFTYQDALPLPPQ